MRWMTMLAAHRQYLGRTQHTVTQVSKSRCARVFHVMGNISEGREENVRLKTRPGTRACAQAVILAPG